MDGREDRVRREATELWRVLFRSEPPDVEDGSDLLAAALQRLEPARYERLNAAGLKDRSLVWPSDGPDPRLA